MADLAWQQIHADLTGKGIEHRLFGSLARNDFRSHSDIDVMVFGDLDLSTKVAVRKLVYASSKNSGIICDLLFAMDMTSQSVEAILVD